MKKLETKNGVSFDDVFSLSFWLTGDVEGRKSLFKRYLKKFIDNTLLDEVEAIKTGADSWSEAVSWSCIFRDDKAAVYFIVKNWDYAAIVCDEFEYINPFNQVFSLAGDIMEDLIYRWCDTDALLAYMSQECHE